MGQLSLWMLVSWPVMKEARQAGLCGEVCGKVIIKEEGRSRNAASLSRF